MSRAGLVVLLAVVVVLGGLRGYTVVVQRTRAKAYPTRAFVTVDDVRLHYASAGRGQPIVLLHGDGGSALDFTMSPLFDRLAATHRVVAFDRPGHGYSEAGHDAGSLFGQAELIRAAVVALDLHDPVLVGHSRGASVMAAYLDRYPGEVAAAVSLGGAMLPDTDPPAYTFYRPGAWPVIGPVLVDTVYTPAARLLDFRVLRDSLDRAFAPEGAAPDDYVQAYACQWVSRSNITTTYRLSRDADRVLAEISERYRDMAVPLVIVHGDADHNVRPDDAIRLHDAVPGSRLHLLRGGGHEPQFTRPADIIDALTEASMAGSRDPASG